jgi:hypothetical protein
MTISKRQAKEFWTAWAAGKTPEPKTVRAWMAPAASPPIVRTPSFMLGGRLAVIREPHFMLGVAPGASTPASGAEKEESAVDAADKSPHAT